MVTGESKVNKKRLILINIYAVMLLVLGLLNNVVGQTIYVDVNNVDGPWDGTIEHPFRSISKAYLYVNDADTIFVFQGYYSTGDFELDKSIILTGEDRNTTILGAVFYLNVDGITICNFTFGHGYISKYSPGIAINSNNNTIRNNIITGRYFGIVFWGGDSNLIEGNIIENCYNISSNGGVGISVWAGNNFNIIRKNIIRNNNRTGIRLVGSHQGNLISDNTIIRNEDGIVFWDDLTQDHIFNNTIENNSNCGISIGSEENIIYGNTLKNNKYEIFLTIGNNIIKHNNFMGNHSNVSFQYSERPYRNLWERNYWGQPCFLLKPIQGTLIFYPPFEKPYTRPWLNFDLFPRLKP
jgi:parallel beta-helix repeat protein